MGNLKKVPDMRFPEFITNWESRKFGNLIERISNPVTVELDELYQQIGIRSFGKGIFYKEFVDGKALGNKRVFWVKENCLIVNIVFAWEQAVAKTTTSEVGMIASHRFPMYLPVEKVSDLDYLLHFFLTPKGKTLLELASPGGAGRNKTLGQKEFENLKFFVPECNEQKKIASLLTFINKKVNQLNEKHNLLKKYKKGVMQKLFSKKLRFKDCNGIEFPKWEKVKLKECLNYEQPTKYLVTNTNYNDSCKVPVVTAGKTFILGYTDEDYGIYNDDLPVIIFDDFTTSSQFVDFPFKAKSSAMKILKATENIDIKFIFEAIQNLNYEIEGHNRHWISVFAEMMIEVPVIEEQLKIADFLSKIDEKIKQTQNQIGKVAQYKNGLVQKMFC